MKKTDLYDVVATEAALSKTAARRAVNAVLRAIRDTTLKDRGEVSIPGFGKFYASELPKRKVVVPPPHGAKHGYIVEAPPIRVIRFKPYKGGRKLVRK